MCRAAYAGSRVVTRGNVRAACWPRPTSIFLALLEVGVGLRVRPAGDVLVVVRVDALRRAEIEAALHAAREVGEQLRAHGVALVRRRRRDLLLVVVPELEL